jgi:hypothetical protein
MVSPARELKGAAFVFGVSLTFHMEHCALGLVSRIAAERWQGPKETQTNERAKKINLGDNPSPK